MGHMVADAIPLPSPVAVSAGLPMSLPASTGGYVIITIALVDASTGAAALHAIVADAARQTLDHPNPASGGDGADWADPAASEAESPASLEDAVVAAHERRIAVLRERMAALCASGATAPVLGALRDRLQRAEAARRLALVRVGDGASDDADRSAASDPGCRIGLAMARERHHDGLSSARLTIAHRWSRAPMTASHRGAGARTLSLRYARAATSPARPGRRAVIAAIYAGSYHRRAALVAAHHYRVKVVAAGYAPDRRGVRRGAGPRVAARLVRARRSLAAARQALEGGVPTTRPAGRLAGLWRWDGSATWSLAPHGAAAG